MTDAQWATITKALQYKAKEYGVDASDPNRLWSVVLRNEWNSLQNFNAIERYVKQKDLEALYAERDARDASRPLLESKISDLEDELSV